MPKGLRSSSGSVPETAPLPPIVGDAWTGADVGLAGAEADVGSGGAVGVVVGAASALEHAAITSSAAKVTAKTGRAVMADSVRRPIPRKLAISLKNATILFSRLFDLVAQMYQPVSR